MNDLIAEAREADAPEVHARLIARLADALEAAEAERDDLETRLSGYLCDSTGGLLSKTGYDVRTMVAHTEEYYDRLHAEDRAEVEAARDAALAVIEKAREAVKWGSRMDANPTRMHVGQADMWWQSWHLQADEAWRKNMTEALSSVPADVLRERDAARWDEGARWAAVECAAIDDERQAWIAPGDNPYRKTEEESND